MLKCMVCGKLVWTTSKKDGGRVEAAVYNCFQFWFGWCSDECHDTLLPRLRRLLEQMEDDFTKAREQRSLPPGDNR